jgi:hypothetical protein
VRLRLIATALAALALAACSGASATSTSGQASPTPSVASASPVPDGQPCPAAGVKYQPTKYANQGEFVASGSYLAIREGKVQAVPVTHRRVQCGQPFTEVLDFTGFENDYCQNDPSAPVNKRRPCYNGFRDKPDQTDGQLLNTTQTGPKPKPKPDGGYYWRPLEGKDHLTVLCQVTGNTNTSQGAKQNNQRVLNNVINWVIPADHTKEIEGGRQMAWEWDALMGNAGWQGPACNGRGDLPNAMTVVR